MAGIGGRNKFKLEDIDQPDSWSAGELPIYTIPQIADYLTKGYWHDFNDWGPRGWTDKTITYDVSALSAERQVLAKMAFAAWGEICGLDFSEFTGGASAQIGFIMEAAAPAGQPTAWATDDAFSGKVISSAQIHLAANFDADTEINSSAFETIIHELGHVLGLGHAGNYNGTGGGGPHYQNDTRQFSIMSYVAQGNYHGASSLDVLTPQMADIYAVIKKYGAAEIRETNTTYGYNASGLTADTGYVYDFSHFGNNDFGPVVTIVDTGGIDTLDLSGYWYDQKIDLRGGKFSDVGQWKGNVGIYVTSVIENAIGGQASDHIYGNQVANKLYGNEEEDFLYGLTGNDRLYGGTESDTFFMREGWDRDRAMDFEKGIDNIDLQSFDFARFSQVRKIASDVNGHLVLNFSDGDTLTVIGLVKAEMVRSDFLI